jgi:kynurenine formamidase
MHYIDLSQTVFNNMPVYPSDTPVTLFQENFLEKDHYNNFRLQTGMHAGTHIDTPMHLTESTTAIDCYPIDRFTGNGCLLDVRNQSNISYQNSFSDSVKSDDIVLLFTGHSGLFSTDSYYQDYPVIDQSFTEFLIEKRVKVLGMDSPSPDRFPFDIHKLLFKHDILIIENLTNLKILLDYDRFEIFAFPLKIKADSSPVRVVARVDSI